MIRFDTEEQKAFALLAIQALKVSMAVAPKALELKRQFEEALVGEKQENGG